MEEKMQRPSTYWRESIESEDSFSEMLRTSVAKLSIREPKRYHRYVEPGDGVCLTTYDLASKTGCIRAVGIALSVDEPNRLLRMKWAPTNFTVKPMGRAQQFWQKPNSQISQFDYIDTLFSEHFPELTDEKPQVNYLEEPDRYFMLEVSSHFEVNVNHLLPHFGRIYTGAEWEALGLCPYNNETVYPNGTKVGPSYGTFRIDQYVFGFTPMTDLVDGHFSQPNLFNDIQIDDVKRKKLLEWLAEFKDLPLDTTELDKEEARQQELTAAFKNKKRYVSNPWDVYSLRKMSVPYDEISNLTEFDRCFSEGRLAMGRKDFPSAIHFLKAAEKLGPNDWIHQIEELLFEARQKSGDLGVIEDGLAYYVNDMHAAIYGGTAEAWLRLAMDVANDYRLALDVTFRIISGVEAEIASDTDSTKARYYRAPSIDISSDEDDTEENDEADHIDSCKRDRDQFIKRLGTLKGFLSKNLIQANLDRADAVKKLLTQIANANPAKMKKIEEFRTMLSVQH